jgi:NAD(P) transhydrogenase subunit alpha
VLTLDMDDVVQRGIAVTRSVEGGGETAEVMWPPPPVQVSAAPAAPAAQVVEKEPPPPPDPRRKWYAAGLAGVLFALLAAFSPGEFLGHFTVFALAVVAGYYVISNVAHALHTPLMAETNAISGIILVGGILQVGTASNALILVLAAIAVLVASINIFGGFLVTLRMLQMFRKG